MPSPRVGPVLEGRILALLDCNKKHKTYEWIINEIKRTTGKKISNNRIRQAKRRRAEGKGNFSPKKRSAHKMIGRKPNQLKKMAESDNPKTQRVMAEKLKVSQRDVNYWLHKKLDLKVRKKKMVHRLSERNRKQRADKAPELKRILTENLRDILSSDEGYFSISLGGGKRNFRYEPRTRKSTTNNRTSNIEKDFKEREERFTSKFMVWVGVSYHSKTNLYFIKPGAKINSKYYQKNVIDKFMDRDRKRMFGNRSFLWHQDSAPSHTSSTTVDYFKEKGIKVITKEQWPAKSPDCAPMDFFVFGWLKNQLRKKRFRTSAGLKRALKQCWRELPQGFIQNAFDSWPRRIQKVIDAKGGHF